MRPIVADYKSSLFPDIPTFADKGYPQIDLIGSIGLLGPKGLPPSVIKSWDTALKALKEKPELLGPFQKVGFNIDLLTGTDTLRKFYKDEVQKYSRFTPEQLGWKQ